MGRGLQKASLKGAGLGEVDVDLEGRRKDQRGVEGEKGKRRTALTDV